MHTSVLLLSATIGALARGSPHFARQDNTAVIRAFSPDGSSADTTLAADGILVDVNQPPNGLSGALILQRPNEQVSCLYFCDGGQACGRSDVLGDEGFADLAAFNVLETVACLQ